MTDLQRYVLSQVAQANAAGQWYRAARAGERVTLASLYRRRRLERRPRAREGSTHVVQEGRDIAFEYCIAGSALSRGPAPATPEKPVRTGPLTPGVRAALEHVRRATDERFAVFVGTKELTRPQARQLLAEGLIEHGRTFDNGRASAVPDLEYVRITGAGRAESAKTA